MSSPDAPDARGAFDRRIDEAARSLQRAAPPGMLERIRERAGDLDSAIETAARAIPGEAPLDAFDVRIAAAARELARPAPADYATIRARAGRAQRSRLVVLRSAVALAASLLLAVFVFSKLSHEASAKPGLLDDAALERSRQDEARLDREAERLERRVTGDPEVVANAVAQSLMEEAEFLEQAIAECRDALEVSQAHGHLRERLIELTARRVELLRQIAGTR